MKKKNAFSDIEFINNQKLKILILTNEFNIKTKGDLNNFESLIEYNNYDNIEIAFLKSGLFDINNYIVDVLKIDVVELDSIRNYNYFVSKEKDFFDNKFSIDEIENIANLYLVNVKMFRLNYNFIIDECGYYMYKIGDVFPKYEKLCKKLSNEKGELSAYKDSLSKRLGIYCITIDNLYINLLNKKSNISVDQVNYHFIYYVLQIKSIMDNIAEIIKLKYDLSFKYKNDIALFNGNFKSKVKENSKTIFECIENNSNINEIIKYYRNDFAHGRLAEIMTRVNDKSDNEEIIIKINKDLDYSLYNLDNQVSSLGKDKYLSVFYVVEILNKQFAKFIDDLFNILSDEWYLD